MLVRACFSSIRLSELPIHGTNSKTSINSSSSKGGTGTWRILYCFFGLMTSYLAWGLLQEKIITQPYESITPEGHRFEEHFNDSQFLVFANRLLAFLMALVYLCAKNQFQSTSSSPITAIAQIIGSAPLFKYSFASFSNVMSAWFQYEALKYVNFPTQVLAKSCKIIPVMLMGKIVSRAKFEFYEYLTAAMISIGMLAFLLGSKSDHHSISSITSMTGILLLTMYLMFDSFTSNWQSDLFKTYNMSSIQVSCNGLLEFSLIFHLKFIPIALNFVKYFAFNLNGNFFPMIFVIFIKTPLSSLSIQMMCGVNLFSALFTAFSLAIQGGFMESFIFATTVSF